MLLLSSLKGWTSFHVSVRNTLRNFFQVIPNSHNSLTPNHRLPARNIMRWKNEIFRADSVKCHAHRADKLQQK